MESITDYRSAIMTAGVFLGPVGWAVGLGAWLFGDSKETKIRNAKAKLREALTPTRNEIIAKTRESVMSALNEQIAERQIGKEFVVFNVADMSPVSKRKIARLIGEKTSIFTVSDEKYILDKAHILIENYLDGNWDFIDFIDDGDRRMSVIALPRYLERNDDAVQIAQQTIGETVVFY